MDCGWYVQDAFGLFFFQCVFILFFLSESVPFTSFCWNNGFVKYSAQNYKPCFEFWQPDNLCLSSTQINPCSRQSFQSHCSLEISSTSYIRLLCHCDLLKHQTISCALFRCDGNASEFLLFLSVSPTKWLINTEFKGDILWKHHDALSKNWNT